jgi:hypothetical protein
MREMLTVDNSPSTAGLNSERCFYIEQSQMGSTSFGGVGLVAMTRKTTPMKSRSIAAHGAAWMLSAASS